MIIIIIVMMIMILPPRVQTERKASKFLRKGMACPSRENPPPDDEEPSIENIYIYIYIHTVFLVE